MAYRMQTLSLVLSHYTFHMSELKRSLFNIFSHDCCCQCAEVVQSSGPCESFLANTKDLLGQVSAVPLSVRQSDVS